jgi:DNA-directed RNA polymerase alpha subunit
MIEIQAYRTADGKFFTSKIEALEHEQTAMVAAKIDSFVDAYHLTEESAKLCKDMIYVWEQRKQLKQFKDGKNDSLYNTNLSKRAIRALASINVKFVSQLVLLSKKDLNKIPDCGKITLDNIEKVLADENLKLAD